MLKSKLGIDETLAIAKAPTFPESTINFLAEKFKSKTLIYQKAADLVRSVEMERNNCELVEVFAKFLSEVYDTRELMFFLYARAQIEKELNLRFVFLNGEKKKLTYYVGGQYVSAQKQYLVSTNEVDSRNVFISARVASKIQSMFFDESQSVYREVWQKIEDRMVFVKGAKDRYISAIEFLAIVLAGFHNARVDVRSEDKYATADFARRYEEHKVSP